MRGAFLTPNATTRRVLRLALFLFAVALGLALGPMARGQRLPLPPREQAAVDRAIDGGVQFLKATTQKNGTWALFGARHAIGYAALPGLTLLECGVPADDPILQQTARCLRSHTAKLDTTYELSLAILFLDRLGDPQDSKLIQTFALRLIAGQSATGGWGYKCPVPSPKLENDLLAVLRHLNPPPLDRIPALAARPGDMPAIATRPGDRPGLTGGMARKRGDLGPVAQVQSTNPIEGTSTVAAKPPLSGTVAGVSPDASLHPEASLTGSPSLRRDEPRGKLGSPELSEKTTDSKRAAEMPRLTAGARPPDLDPKEARPGAAKPADGEPEKPFVIPERLRRLPVIQDPAEHIPIDPVKRSRELVVTTTDNSNTQFAILALWTAQRHGVPMERTLKLIVRRYLTSQNGDGTWGYHYRFGGGVPSRAAMTCIGLIGLAVGHGLANQEPGGKPVRDPRILNGLAALSRFIGNPAGQPTYLPMEDLYFLWSVERVAVLYNLPKIGDKDWYRWGAEILVANQGVRGNWANGLYPGNSPTIDTCLALLFLKRANLVKDLTAKLPFKPADLNGDLMRQLDLTSPSAPSPKPADLTRTMMRQITPPRTAPLPSKSPESVNDTVATPTPEPAVPPVSEGGGNNKKWAVLFFALFVILAAGSLYFFLAARDRKKKKDEGFKPKRRTVRGKLKPMASDPGARE